MEKAVLRPRKARIDETRKKKMRIRNTKLATVTVAAAVTASAIGLGGKEAKASAGTYEVEKGDTLYRISKDFDLTVQQLKEMNDLHSDKIFPGQKLEVPTEYHTTETFLQHAAIYTVVPGDTLWSIADRYGVPVSELKSLNHLQNDMVLIHQRLIIMEDIAVQSAKIIGAADNFTVEFQTGGRHFALKVPYGTAQEYQRLAGKTVIVTHKNGSVINIQK
ncbi:LysM peptidoglycan-binding domain-containing protein [Cytobacillus gottheilii]|uniref:LysM peptidoglycan-binding domain-containing protein n=1 Tax=Cytobacillus gottheilii TaxID=859144 RepID=A0ABX8FBY3_9BACI|nr:LysM peptidoglycan-binding domain-containing protein [Cytobacillus gottheilii]QVY61358.1 LysM peptidoglycan-binding domain-containing protein [Cytobacillus gottheilii]